MKAIIYTRFSPRPNPDETTSCERQKTACQKYCEQQNYYVSGYFEDRALSGNDADRPGLWAAVAALTRGGVLVVRWRSRLARDVYLAEIIDRAVAKAGATIEAVEGSVNGDSPENKMIRQIFAALAEYERKIIGIRTKYAMLQHQKSGQRMSKRIPYGWSADPADPKRMVPNPDERAAIAEMRRLRSAGQSWGQIVDELDMLFSPRTGEGWDRRTIRRLVARDEF